MLVGGSTRIPQLIFELFPKDPNKVENVDEAVVYGAALQAAILSGDNSESIHNTLLVDFAPKFLDVEAAGGVMAPLIERNTTIPAEESETSSISIRANAVAQILKYLALHGISQVRFTFDSDANGILPGKSAVAKGNGKLYTITGSGDKGGLPPAECPRIPGKMEMMDYREGDETNSGRFQIKRGPASYVYSEKSVLDVERLATPDNTKSLDEKSSSDICEE